MNECRNAWPRATVMGKKHPPAAKAKSSEQRKMTIAARRAYMGWQEELVQSKKDSDVYRRQKAK